MTEHNACPLPDPRFRSLRATEAEELGVLVERCAAGDREAFAELYKVVAPIVHGVCRRVMVDRGLAEETAQDVMVELWSKSAGYRPERGTVFAWAATVAHRRSVDRVRSEVSRRRREAALPEERELDGTDEALLREEDGRRVRDCLETLTELESQAVVHAYYDGLSYTEVATRLASPLPTVKSRIRSGLIRLRGCLEGN
ncbi:RNA polymerase subunit sigma [Galactobacter valiniphilus]|uniref:RNA polymerase subunit sigma n=1 Tax=Galactobacter valiniphilus TaxID=2676122 RepID=A0A399JCW1_9MICC|nr:sigma-70 family RNA polymerase sigma factor [Galactobacter valiniphilus]RII42397.1 RNA polymerase subunit sigma [Galactobacter valiniphilus]